MKRMSFIKTRREYVYVGSSSASMLRRVLMKDFLFVLIMSADYLYG